MTASRPFRRALRRAFRRPLRAAALLGVACAAPGCYGLSGGVVTAGTPDVVARENVQDPTLAAAAREVEAGRGGQAFKRLVRWFREQPDRQREDVALWLAANALIDRGDRIRAFYYLEQLLDQHPASPLYNLAAQKQYEIADSYLDGKGDRFLVFPVHHGDEAIEMLFRVQLRLPGSPLAERAVKRTADYYFDREDYDFAEDAYGVFVDRFPRSPQIATVRLKQAYSNILQYNGPRYDPPPLLDGGTQLRQFAAEFPQLAQEQRIGDILRWIDEQLAEKLAITASFYGRTSEPGARRQLLAQIVEQHPATPQADRARRILGHSPAGGAADAPATRPATTPGPAPSPAASEGP